jgi:hypothetical protein
MERAASGHRAPQRLVFNVGSGLIRPLYRDFLFDETLAIDNNCGGDQRYNLQGRYEKPELWKLPRHRIHLQNLCFIKNVALAGPWSETQVSWELEGAWDRIVDAKISIYLQQTSGGPNGFRDVAKLVSGLPCDSEPVRINLSSYRGKGYRLLLRRDGDPETGGQSMTFDLE